ncbi:MAG: sulfotransferase [Anaerolineales bacterium]|jgi:hypothetical protein|nr:sulfotransferase [Anaerolineales bacterium]MDX9936561.1 sulfotransferase [Anaerolineales bacterium]GER80381.1 conserved hypothetical protein [Candidatus Denitrolinea symbiosum]
MTDTTAMQKIIFVVGNSRSGTTMLGRVLGCSSDVLTFNELHFFEQMWTPSMPAGEISLEKAVHFTTRLLGIQREGYYAQVEPHKYRREAEALVSAQPGKLTAPQVFAAFLDYEAKRRGKTVACDQTPRNLFYIRELLAYYPNAYIVHIVRDPRDVLLSQKNRWLRRSYAQKKFPMRESVRYWVNYHPISISLLWESGIKAWERRKGLARVYSIRFEDLIEDPEKIIRAICQFLELEYSPAMLEVPQVGSSHGADRPERFGINKDIAGRWQRASRSETVDLVICQKITAKRMLEFGYPLAKFRFNPFYYLWVLMLWPVKALMAILVNLDKSRNIFAFIRRRL